METYLQVENLSKSFGSHILFENISFGVNEGEKIGIIAKNGTGKSTLLNVLAGVDTPDSGNVIYHNDIRIGYLSQQPAFKPDMTILEACLDNDIPGCKVLKDYEELLQSGGDVTPLLQEMDATAAWQIEDSFRRMLHSFKIQDFNQKIGQLSGGQLKKVSIAAVLVTEPDFLLLDEPTNHLDIEMIEFLEDYLTRSKATLLMVTHDRYFLDNVCNKIIEMDNSGIYTYQGNYNYYLEKRAERLENMASEITKAKNLYRKELDWMRRQPQARATKAKYRIDAFYDLQDKAKAHIDDNKVKLGNASEYIGNKIFEAHHISKSFDNIKILDDFNYIFSRYDKLGIVGDNGVGKSTFIKLLQGISAPDSGKFDIGDTVRFGYYKQETDDVDINKKVIDMAREIAEVVYLDEKNSLTASQYLTRFLFNPADQQKYVYKLSGGERRRLSLALMLMRKPNFIILDEPTNDLDIATLEILEEYIEEFKGCVIIVSHDRFFMDKCVNHIFVFEGQGKIKDFPGNYSEYREWKKFHESQSTSNQDSQQSATKKQESPKRDYSNKLSYKEKLELEKITAEIAALEAEKFEIEEVFNGNKDMKEGESFDNLSKRFASINDLLDSLELRWLELSEKEQ